MAVLEQQGTHNCSTQSCYCQDDAYYGWSGVGLEELLEDYKRTNNESNGWHSQKI